MALILSAAAARGIPLSSSLDRFNPNELCDLGRDSTLERRKEGGREREREELSSALQSQGGRRRRETNVRSLLDSVKFR